MMVISQQVLQVNNLFHEQIISFYKCTYNVTVCVEKKIIKLNQKITKLHTKQPYLLSNIKLTALRSH